MKHSLAQTTQPLPFLAKFLHWVVMVFVIGLLATGLYMDTYEAFYLYSVHKSLGIIAFVFILWRVVYRVLKGWSKPVNQNQKYEQMLSKLIHWVLIISTLLMPISGMLMSAMNGQGIFLFGLEIYPVNYASANKQVVVPVNIDMASIGHQMHGMVANVLLGAIALHVLGACKHHFIDKDDTLKRMMDFR